MSYNRSIWRKLLNHGRDGLLLNGVILHAHILPQNHIIVNITIEDSIEQFHWKQREQRIS